MVAIRRTLLTLGVFLGLCLSLCALAALPACNHVQGRQAPVNVRARDPIGVLIAVRGPAEQDIVSGIQAWAKVTRGVREWQILRPPLTVVPHVVITDVPPGVGLCSPDAYGCVNDIGGLWEERAQRRMVWLIRGRYEDKAHIVVMHELGHLLGLSHLDGTLMAGRWSQEMALAHWECPDPVSVSILQGVLDTPMSDSCPRPVY